jgi:hypothetical protein
MRAQGLAVRCHVILGRAGASCAPAAGSGSAPPSGAARSVSKLHPQLAKVDADHVTSVDGPDGGAGPQQLSLTT